MSMHIRSSDGLKLAVGTTEGSISIYNHDLQVCIRTCISDWWVYSVRLHCLMCSLSNHRCLLFRDLLCFDHSFLHTYHAYMHSSHSFGYYLQKYVSCYSS